MKRVSIFVLTSLLFLLISHTGYAVAPTQKEFCLDAVACNSNPCSVNNGHRVRLKTRTDAKLLPNKEAYIIACVSGDGSSLPICTTGTTATDTIIYKKDVINEEMNKTPAPNWGYKFEGLFGADGVTSPNGAGKPANPVMVKSNGEIDILEWQDSTTNGKSRLWKALFLVDPSEGIGAEGAGVKQNDLDFDSAGRACVKISWDPWGRVFDAQTLEPVAGANVSLLYKNASGVFEDYTAAASLITKNNGKYEIVVPPGFYKIKIAAPLIIATDPADINSAYKSAYYEVYDGTPIEEVPGMIAHRDVAVKVTPPTHTPLGVEYFIESGAIGVTVSGTVTHPKSVVSINTIKSTELLKPESERVVFRNAVASATADRDGNFSVLVNQANLQRTNEFQEMVYNVSVTQVDLVTGNPIAKNSSGSVMSFISQFLGSLFHSVYGQTKTVTFSIPVMPTYISGYAYDAAGKVIPNAMVGLYLTFSNAPSYEVKADANGFFRITSKDIPTMPFDIKYTTPTGQVVTTSTSQFIAQNHKTNVVNKTSPFEYRDSSNAVITPLVVRPTSLAGNPGSKSGTTTGGSGTNPGVNPGSTTRSNPAVTQTLIVLILLILLLGGVGVGVMFYMKNKTPRPGTF